MFCPNCGAQNPEGTVFCASCGAKVATEQPAAQPAFQQPVYQQPAPQQPVYQQPAYQQPVYQQPVYQQPVQQPTYRQPAAPDAPVPGKVLGIVGMVLGILALICTCTFYYCWLGFLFGLPAIILSSIAKGKAKSVGGKNGMATAGFVCSLITLILDTLFIMIILIALGGLAAMF